MRPAACAAWNQRRPAASTPASNRSTSDSRPSGQSGRGVRSSITYKPPGTQQGDCPLAVGEFPGQGVGENQVESLAAFFEKGRAVLGDERNAAVGAKNAFGGFRLPLCRVNAGEAGMRAHAVENPGGGLPDARAQFEHAAARLRGRQHS